MPLPGIAHFPIALEQHLVGGEVAHQNGARFVFHVCKGFFQRSNGPLVERGGESHRHIKPRIRKQHTDGGEVAGLGRNHHGRDRQFTRQRAGMQRPAAAIAEQHEFARVETMLDGDLLDRARHNDSGERHDSVRHPDHAIGAGISERFGNPLHRLARRRELQFEFSAKEAFGIKPPEHQIGIGHGRLGPALAVTSRSGRRAGALRADRQAVLRIEPGDRAAAGADLDDVDHRRFDRKPLHIAAGIID